MKSIFAFRHKTKQEMLEIAEHGELPLPLSLASFILLQDDKFLLLQPNNIAALFRENFGANGVLENIEDYIKNVGCEELFVSVLVELVQLDFIETEELDGIVSILITHNYHLDKFITLYSEYTLSWISSKIQTRLPPNRFKDYLLRRAKTYHDKVIILSNENIYFSGSELIKFVGLNKELYLVYINNLKVIDNAVDYLIFLEILEEHDFEYVKQFKLLYKKKKDS